MSKLNIRNGKRLRSKFYLCDFTSSTNIDKFHVKTLQQVHKVKGNSSENKYSQTHTCKHTYTPLIIQYSTHRDRQKVSQVTLNRDEQKKNQTNKII